METASIQGIRSRVYYPLGFGLGVGLAAVAGALMAPLFSVSPFIGATPLLKAFIVVILGGLGSIPGAAVAGLALGLTELRQPAAVQQHGGHADFRHRHRDAGVEAQGFAGPGRGLT